MQWFTALAEGSATFPYFVDLTKVAIHTALKFTRLRPHILYDGSENEFTAWLRKRDVKIIPCRSVFSDQIVALESCRQDRNQAAGICGTFLRVELPEWRERLGLDDYVLYTDCDVFFQRDVGELSAIKCQYFAVAGQFTPDDYENMNNGVMWSNLPALEKVTGDFKRYIRENLVMLEKEGLWGQGAYKNFFRKDGVPLWDKLRPELNWKPYWGVSPEAVIIHFHGPKPFQREYFGDHVPHLRELTGGGYRHYCELFDKFLAEAG